MGEKETPLEGTVKLARISPDGEYVVGTSENNVIFWSALDGKKIRELQGHTGPVDRMAWSPDGARLAAASRHREVIVWEGKEP